MKHSNNQRMKWKCLNKILPKKNNKQMSSEIVFENGATSHDYEISNKFNDFFIKSIIHINEQIPNENEICERITPNHFFKFKYVDVDKIQNITKNLTQKINKSQICNSMVCGIICVQ